MATRSKLQGEEVTATVEDPALSAERAQALLTDHQDRKIEAPYFWFLFLLRV